jgi:sulfur-oxidizing protein SoxZ
MAQTIRGRAVTAGDTTEVRLLITHPNENGLRKDGDGKPVPAHHLKQLTIANGDVVLMRARLSGGISKDPVLAFRVQGAKANDRLLVAYEDTKGNKESLTVTVAAS